MKHFVKMPDGQHRINRIFWVSFSDAMSVVAKNEFSCFESGKQTGKRFRTSDNPDIYLK